MSSLPSSRTIRRPYVLLRTPNNLDSYVNSEFRRLLNSSEKQHLGRFLAPLLSKDEAKSGKLDFDLSAMESANPEKMTYLPETLRRDFLEAIDHFLAPTRSDAVRISDHEKRLRAGFKLPDPDLEPDAYWLYGPVDDRRLMIIWGCEFKQNSSLPLTDSDPARPGVLEKLSAHAPTWRQTQDAAVQLVREKNLPLAKFLAKGVVGASGSIENYWVQGKQIPASECKSLGAKVPEAFVDEFQKAAQQQLELALPDAQTSEYAKSLIKALALPDPSKQRHRFLQTKTGLLVVLDGKELESESLLPTGDVRLDLPPTIKAADGIAIPAETVVDKLRKGAKKPSRLPYYSAAAGLLLALAGLAWYILSDTSPPQLKDIVISEDPTTLLLVFNERLSSDSLQDWANTINLQSDRGYFVPITNATFEPGTGNNSIRLILGTPMQEAGYTASIRGISDPLGNTLQDEIAKRFEFRDTTPLQLLLISAHPTNPNQLIIDFNKPLLERSVRPASFQITGFRVTEATLSNEQQRVILTTEQRFEHGLTYSLQIEDLRDATTNENRLKEATHRFQYLDIIPPSVVRVSAEQNQITIQVVFSKAVERTSAENPGNYRIFYLNPQGAQTEVPIRTLQLLADQLAVNIFTATPLQHGISYQILINNIQDTATPPNTLQLAEPIAFAFRGAIDRSPPAFSQVRTVRGENDRILISFNRPVTPQSALQAVNYTVDTADVEIVAVHATGNPTDFVLETAPRLPTSAAHTISVTAIEDFMGNKITGSLQSRPFAAEGPTEPMNTLLQGLISNVEAQANGTRVVITFQDLGEDFTLIPARAADRRNYRFSAPVEIEEIELYPEHAPIKITLTLSATSPLPRGRHTITLRNMRLQDAPNSIEAPASFSFNH